ncbi:MAG: hypothetical protein IID60_12945 [Proteobacteria bacterium]|nr:hypothetical protein [Pseudomonadota bacterium]
MSRTFLKYLGRGDGLAEYLPRNVPTFLKTKFYIDFSKTDDFEFSYDELIRTLHDSPLYEKPDIGNSPFTPVEEIQPEKITDALRELMTIVVSDFERGADYSVYQSVVERIRISRIMLDMLIYEALEKDLITQDSDKDLRLAKKGKFYAIEHKLINA